MAELRYYVSVAGWRGKVNLAIDDDKEQRGRQHDDPGATASELPEVLEGVGRNIADGVYARLAKDHGGCGTPLCDGTSNPVTISVYAWEA